MVWQVGGRQDHGAELMIATVSMHVIRCIDILGPTFVMSGRAMAPCPPVPPPMYYILSSHVLWHDLVLSYYGNNN